MTCLQLQCRRNLINRCLPQSEQDRSYPVFLHAGKAPDFGTFFQAPSGMDWSIPANDSLHAMSVSGNSAADLIALLIRSMQMSRPIQFLNSSALIRRGLLYTYYSGAVLIRCSHGWSLGGTIYGPIPVNMTLSSSSWPKVSPVHKIGPINHFTRKTISTT